MESALRPRDIQARIRAGESPESVAAAAQTTLDRVMSYATPVLAERAHIAERAQRASVRRRSGEGPSRPLGDAVAEHLRARNVDPAAVEWDAWRREDGRWTLVADYRRAPVTRPTRRVRLRRPGPLRGSRGRRGTSPGRRAPGDARRHRRPGTAALGGAR